jgi:PAS domain S-box-containing protein
MPSCTTISHGMDVNHWKCRDWCSRASCSLFCICSFALTLLIPLEAAVCAVPQVYVDPEPIRLPMADGKEMQFTRLSTEDGLSQTRVSQIVQGNRGFIWFGTQYGLNRYDGYKFKVFVHDRLRANSLGGTFVTALFKDHAGLLWIGCASSLDRFDPITETFAHYRIASDDSKDLSGTVVHISEDSDGMLWLATGAGLHKLDPASGKLVHYRHDPNDATSLSSNDVKSSGVDRMGNFWVGTSEGLDRFDRTTEKVTLHVALPEPIQISFYEDRLGIFWIFHASGNGLAILDRRTNRLTQYSFYEQTPSSSELTGVMAMVEDDGGNLWLGSPGVGLLQFDREHQRFIHYKNDPANPESLAEDKVIALFRDREGNIWAGLHSMAPNRFRPGPPLFEKFQHNPGNPNSLDANFVNAIYEDRRGFLWIGNDNGLTRIDRRTGQYTRFRAGLGVKPMVITIIEDRSGVIWVGSYGHGLARLDETTGQFTTYNHKPDDPTSLSNDQVHRLFVDHAGIMWIATDDGLDRFDSETERFTTYKVDWQSRRSQAYVAIAEDQQGTLWLGTHYSGLHRFEPATGKFTVYKSDPGSPGSLRDDMVPTVHIDRSGAIWVGTQSGLDRLDPKTGTFTAYDEGENLPSSTVSCILEDKRGNLWMSSNQGLSKFDPQNGTFKRYTVADGLPGNDLTGWGTGFESASGEMFFAGFAGAIAFYPDRLVDSPYVPPVVLTDFRSPYSSPDGGAASLLQKAIGRIPSLTLPYDRNSFSLEFSALSFFNPLGNRYRYKLEGLDQRWNEVSSDRRSATYTTLPPGNYRFRVQGATVRGPWSEPGIVLPVTVLTAWWQTWWFRIGVAIALVALTFWRYRVHIKNIQNRERDFRKLAENAPDMVMRFDSQLRCVYVNPLVEHYIGLHPREILGKTNEELAALGKHLPILGAGLRVVFDKGQPIEQEVLLSSSRGERHFESRLAPEFETAGFVKSVLAITRDITERKRTECELRRSEQALREAQAALAHVSRVTTVGEMTASIAHEINQPLAAIATNANASLRWLARDSPNLTEAREAISRIIRDGKRASEVITGIKAFFKKAPAAKERVDINEIIEEVLTLTQTELQRQCVALRTQFADNLPIVIGDKIQLQQVILNLVINGIEAMSGVDEGPRELCVVSRKLTQMREGADQKMIEENNLTKPESSFLIVEVRDSGPGLNATEMEHVFESFYTTKSQGIGMGLAISRSIIEAHYGRLWATANAPRGAIFQFTLPV